MMRMSSICIALVLGALSLSACERKQATSPVSAEVTPTTLHLKVKGMSCEGCEHAIAETLAGLPGVIEVKAAHASGEVDVRTTDPASRDAIVKAIEKLNYAVES